jgi:hypothetical protein
MLEIIKLGPKEIREWSQEMLNNRVELRIKARTITAKELCDWLDETIGIRGKDWEATISWPDISDDDFLLFPGIYVFVFTREEDGLNFQMRWS